MAYHLGSLCGPNVFPDFSYLSLVVGLSEISLLQTPLQLLLSQILNTCSCDDWSALTSVF